MSQANCRVVNMKNNRELAVNAVKAESFISRLVGLLSYSHLEKGHGILFTDTNSIHTFFMRFAIDVVFLDRNGVVQKTVANLKPWRIVAPVLSARHCLELPIGTLTLTDTCKGDRLHVETPRA